MIDNERVRSLSADYLKQMSGLNDEFDCWGLECNKCPFQLKEPYYRDGPSISYRCALAYAIFLYGRLHE